MKKLLLASAVAALSITAAQAAPTIYGKAFLTMDLQDGDLVGNDNHVQLNSNGSRIGLKGSEALTANTDLVYKLEYGIRVDNNRSAQFTGRDSYLGLSNAQYGTFVAGALSAIDGEIDYANVASGSVLGGDGVPTRFDGNRIGNAIAYFSPDYNGMQFMAMHALKEGSVPGKEAYGVGVKYEPEGLPFRGGVSYIEAAGAKYTRVSGAYDVNPMITVGALYQLDDVAGFDKKQNTLTLSGELQTATPWQAYAQLDLVKNYMTNFDDSDNLNNSDDNKYRVLVGGKYAFNKATTGHVYGAYAKQDANGSNQDGYGVGGGIEYKF